MKNNEVRLSELALFLGLILSTIILIAEILVIILCESWMPSAIVGLVLLLSLIPVIMYFNCVISFNDEYFVYRSFLRIKHKYYYKDITGFTKGESSSVLHIGRKNIRIDGMAVGTKRFLSAANKSRRETNCWQIPEVENKLFHGNIKNPGEFIFIFVLFGVIIVGVFSYLILDLHPVKITDLYKYEIQCSNYEIEKDRLVILADGYEFGFEIPEYKKYMDNYAQFIKSFEPHQKLIIYLTLKDTKNVTTSPSIHVLLSEDGITYLSLEKSNQMIKNTEKFIIVIFAIVFCIWLITTLSSVYVMNNAEKYPRLIKWFVKPEYINHKKENGHSRR